MNGICAIRRRATGTGCTAFLSVLTALVLAGRVEAQQAPPDSGTVRLFGAATDSATGSALPGVVVEVAGTRHIATTDANGRFEIAGLAPGSAIVSWRLLGYTPLTVRLTLAPPARRLDVVLHAHPVELPTITRRVERTPEEALRLVQGSTTMSATDLAQMRGQTLGETIEQLPGVAAIQYGPSIAKPMIRGLHSARIVVMNGGVRQEGQQWGIEHAPEIDSFEADEITVVRGEGAVLYGADAMGGVVLVDRPPLPTTSGARGDFQVNAFSNNRQGAASARVEAGGLPLPLIGPAGARLRLTARVAGDATTPNYHLRNTGFEELDVSGALGITRDWGSSQLLFTRFATELGVFGGAHVGNFDDLQRAMTRPPVDSDFSYDIRNPRQQVSHNLLSWKTELARTPVGAATIQYGFQYNQRQEFDNHGPLSSRSIPAFDLRLYTHTLDVRVRHPPAGPLSGTIGFSGMRQGNLSEGKAFLIPEYRLYSGGVYAVEELALGRWTVSTGVRGDYVWQRTFAYADAGLTSPNERRSWSGLAGSVGASYLIGDRWSVAGRVSRAWRAPNVSERFSQGVHHGSAQYELGDTSLTPEKKTGAELTLRHAGKRVQAELSGFWSGVDGFVYLRPGQPVFTIRGAFPGYRYAQDDATLRGIEALGTYSVGSWLSLQASASILRGTFAGSGEPLYDMPADRLSASARFSRAGRGETEYHLELGTVLVRRQDYVPDSTVYALPTAGYALANAEAGVSGLPVLGSVIDLTLAVRNLFDTRYRDYLSRYRLFVDDPGRDAVLRLRVPFGAW
jgi:iron complex outermembrane recepter protein